MQTLCRCQCPSKDIMLCLMMLSRGCALWWCASWCMCACWLATPWITDSWQVTLLWVDESAFFPFFAAVLLLRSEYKTFKSICDLCTAVAQKRNQNDCFCDFWEVFEKQLWWLLSHTGHYTIKKCWFCELIFTLMQFYLSYIQFIPLQINRFLNCIGFIDSCRHLCKYVLCV